VKAALIYQSFVYTLGIMLKAQRHTSSADMELMGRMALKGSFKCSSCERLELDERQ
jgi:hypothetical protein